MPVAVFFAFKMNVARHLLLVLLVPDKRGLRNVAAAGGLAAATLASPFASLNSVLPIVTVALIPESRSSFFTPAITARHGAIVC